jgi:excinuclease ABC subunit C
LNGEPDKSGYRKFRIKTLSGPDDTGMINEVVGRRYKRASEEGTLPDLILIDGGKGQLNAAVAALKKLGVKVPVISLAKREEEIFAPDRPGPLKLPKDSPELHLVQRVRDEAHRFAVKYHKNLRGKAFLSSALDRVKGIGEKRKREILGKFKDLKKLTREDLKNVKGLPGPAIDRILEGLNDRK